jgi:hypothetical protein
MTDDATFLWPSRIELSSLLLAESAQVSDGKLFVMGGGFDCLRSRLPAGLEAAVAMILSVPWPLLEVPYELRLELANADGEATGFRLRAELESTPPSGWREGTPLTVPLVFPVRAELGEPGRYAVRCLIEGEERGRVAFELEQAA